MSQFTRAYDQSGPPSGGDSTGWGSSSSVGGSSASGYSSAGRGGGGGGGGRGGRGRGGPARPHRTVDYRGTMAGWEDKCVVGKPRTKDERYNADEFLSSTKWSDNEELSLGLKEEVVTAADNAGLEWLSLVQDRAIPALTCKEPIMHAIVQAKSGSGKTAAFVAPILSKIDTHLPHTQAVVIVPTYELIDQTREWVDKLGQNLEPPVTVALGMRDSADFDLHAGVCQAHVVIATPSSFERSIKYRKIDTRLLRIVVVDEADHVFTEKGASILSSVRRLLQENPLVQLAFFSATFRGIEKKIATILPPSSVVSKIMLKNDEVMVDEIAQLRVDFSGQHDPTVAKKDFLLQLLRTRTSGGKVIIFVQSKRTVGDVVSFLQSSSIPVSEFSGRLDELERMQTFRQFQAGKTKTLVATDVLARGVDVSDVDLVVNYEMPFEKPQGGQSYHRQQEDDVDMPEEGHMGPETYVHRIGRTGRFGNFGVAVSFMTWRSDAELLGRIERIYGGGRPLIHPVTAVDEVEARAKALHEAITVKRQKRIDERKAKEEAEAAAAAAAGGGEAGAQDQPGSSDAAVVVTDAS